MAWPTPPLDVIDLKTNRVLEHIYNRPQVKAACEKWEAKGFKIKVAPKPYEHIYYYYEVATNYCEPIPLPRHRKLGIKHKDAWKQYCPHLGINSSEGVIDFFRTLDDFKIFKVTSILYGRFLKECFGDVLTEPEIRDIATEFYNEMKKDIDIKWATTGDEIEWVFSNAPGWVSCASTKQPTDPVHQARVYAAGDIHIAYLTTEDGKQVRARAICWPEKKLIAGVYGAKSELTRALTLLGYRSITNASEMDGAKLAKLVAPGGNQCSKVNPYYVGAHIDNFPRFRDEGEHLVADHKGKMGFYLHRCVPPEGFVIPPGGTWYNADGTILSITTEAA